MTTHGAVAGSMRKTIENLREANAGLCREHERLMDDVQSTGKLWHEAEAKAERLREWLIHKGYHAPGQCQHGLNHWIGDHCKYDCAALAPEVK